MAISEGSPKPCGLKAHDNAAFGVEPQGKALASQMAHRRAAADSADFVCKRSQYGGIVTEYAQASHNGYMAS